MNFVNAGSSAVSVYVPGGTSIRRYNPSASLTAVKSPGASGVVAVTVVPGSTAFCSSYTYPRIEPYGVCANAPVALGTHTTAKDAQIHLTLYAPPTPPMITPPPPTPTPPSPPPSS